MLPKLVYYDSQFSQVNQQALVLSEFLNTLFLEQKNKVIISVRNFYRTPIFWFLFEFGVIINSLIVLELNWYFSAIIFTFLIILI